MIPAALPSTGIPPTLGTTALTLEDNMSETIQAYASETSAEPSPVAAASATARRRSVIDTATHTITVSEPDGTEIGTFSAAGLSQAAKDHFALAGMWGYLRGQPDVAAAHKRLVEGHVPAPRQASAEPKLSDWRQAIAMALVEATKKAPEPLTLDQAKAKAAAISRDNLIKAKTDPVVVKYFNKITGKQADAGVLGLLDA